MGQIKDGANVSKVEGTIIDESITLFSSFYIIICSLSNRLWQNLRIFFFFLTSEICFIKCHILKNGMLRSIGSAMSFSVIRILSIGNM